MQRKHDANPGRGAADFTPKRAPRQSLHPSNLSRCPACSLHCTLVASLSAVELHGCAPAVEPIFLLPCFLGCQLRAPTLGEGVSFLVLPQVPSSVFASKLRDHLEVELPLFSLVRVGRRLIKVSITGTSRWSEYHVRLCVREIVSAVTIARIATLRPVCMYIPVRDEAVQIVLIWYPSRASIA